MKNEVMVTVVLRRQFCGFYTEYSTPSELAHETLIEVYKAACRALGIVNRFTPGEFKSKHASNVMRRLQAFRAEMLRRDII